MSTSTLPGSDRHFWRSPAIVALYVLLSLIWTGPLLPSLNRVLPHDLGDPALNTWILWWNSQAVPLTERWWSAPIFFPIQGAFALSETMLSIAVLTTPLMWLGVSPVAAYNVAFVLAIPAAGLAAHLLAYRLTGRHDAALIAGLAYAFSPYRVAQMPHLQTLWTCWMPLGLWALHAYLDTRRAKYLAVLALAWLLNGLTNGYFLVYFAVLVGLWVVWFVRTRRDFMAIAAVLVTGSIPLAPLLVGYVRRQAALGLSRDSAEIGAFSADLTSIWAASRDLSFSKFWTAAPKPEGELYPGFVILALSAVATIVVWRRARAGGWTRVQKIFAGLGLAVAALVVVAQLVGGFQFSAFGVTISLTRASKAGFAATCLVGVALVLDARVRAAWQRRSILFFYVAAAVMMFAFALGPLGRVGGEPFMYQAPYSWLMALPGGRSLRVPARFAMLMMLCLSIAGAIAWRRLFSRLARPALIMTGALGILVDGWVLAMPVVRVPPAVTLGGLDERIPLLEMPMRDLYSDTAAMLRAMEHRRRLINGFSGYAPAHYGPLPYALNEGDVSALSGLQRLGPFAVLANRPEGAEPDPSAMLERVPGASRLYRTPLGPVYLVPGAQAVDRDETQPLERLAIADVLDDASESVRAPMVDGNLETRWASKRPQTVTDNLAILFEREVEVQRIEIDLGRYTLDYPRLLRIVAEAADGTSRVVFENRTAGLAVTATLEDYRAVPLRVDLSEPAKATRIFLAVLEDHKTFHWSISELRVFGRSGGR